MKFFGTVVLSLMILALPLLAEAYIPPSQFIVKVMANKKAGGKTIQVKSVVKLLPQSSGIFFNSVTIWDGKARVLKSCAYDEKGRKLRCVERNKDSFPLAVSLILDADTGDVTKRLKENAIPVLTEQELLKLPDEAQRYAAETEFLAQWPKPEKDAISWVIGKRGKGEPQLWIEKDQFLPLRVVLTGDKGFDMYFDSFKFYNEFPFPSVIEFADKEGTLVLREEITAVTINLKSATLDTAALSDSMWQQLDAELRRIVELYYRVHR
ncbi:MAG: hypothetical protein AABZ06_14775 [Bdellovibrionota bacterium]